MKKNHHARAAVVTTKQHNDNNHVVFFSFQNPEQSITQYIDYKYIDMNSDEYYEPPIDRFELALLRTKNPQHGGILIARKNLIMAGYIGGELSYEDCISVVDDLLIFGDAIILKEKNIYGYVIKLSHIPTINLRRDKAGKFIILQEDEPLIYTKEDVIFIKLNDPVQKLYGIPDYLSCVDSAMLNSDATKFRRRYYNNGGHLGCILYATDPNMSDKLEEEIKAKIELSKGVGNFKSMFINIPNGNPDGIKLIPVGEVGAKDDYSNVKSHTSQDVFTAHRFPAGLGGIIPNNAAGLGDPLKVEEAYKKAEVIPMRKLIQNTINNNSDLKVEFELDVEKIT